MADELNAALVQKWSVDFRSQQVGSLSRQAPPITDAG
jgi:hypothetical protein